MPILLVPLHSDAQYLNNLRDQFTREPAKFLLCYNTILTVLLPQSKTVEI